jgi:sulfate permease, SulP family
VGRDRVRRVDAGDQVTVLDVYGSLLYTGSRTLQARLPSTAGSRAPAVVSRLRGRTSLGAMFLKVTVGYAERLAEAGGCLYLSGLDPHLAERLRHTGRLKDPERIFEATPLVGGSTEEARHAAQEWLVHKQPG